MFTSFQYLSLKNKQAYGAWLLFKYVHFTARKANMISAEAKTQR